ncbi:NAD-dependent epimerase/dehydratase family protein [Flavobacterium sp. KACC 22761]|uniref:NAD-dependent epimerase/dehydratase family protein n=1 Tax=Flavobacterium sp. KACC 22761 TaxID=3092665 RepID=UPI002A749B1F|nr:NAD-dependent epimerase/dehydratase family protein [Flavobacterium sp. KACC 22761]WPO79517.1 NAD-dependent epimerase/dehydratase family protein [Flavobacterium sp. KACC 22761]
MKILLTGASGFLGQEIFKKFSNEDITCLSRSTGDIQVSLENEIPNFEKKFELVIHSAGKAHVVPKTENEKKAFHDINVIGTQNLLMGLERSFIPEKFVFISSVSVYGREVGININENDLLNAKDPYGISKIEAEKLITTWCDQNNVVCTILRLPLLVGKNPPGNLGAMLKAINKGYYFNIGGGIARKSMVLTKDVASFIRKVSPVGGVYNLTDGNHPSFCELSHIIAKNKVKRKPHNVSLFLAKLIGKIGDVLGDKAPLNTFKVKKITTDLTFDDSKARNELNWNPQSVLDYLKDNDL